MGNCVVSLMETKNNYSLVNDPFVEQFKAYGPMSRPVPNTETDTTSAIYRNGLYHTDEEIGRWREKLTTAPTQAQKFAAVCAQRGDAVAFSYRPVEKVEQEKQTMPSGEVKLMEVTYFKERVNLSFRQCWGHIEAFSRGLATLGLPARSIISIYEETRWEWLVSAYAIWLQDMIVSTVYANLGEDALAYALKETESKAIVCNGKSVPSLLRRINAGDVAPCTLIYLDRLPAGCVLPSEKESPCKVISWQRLEELGRTTGAALPAQPPADNDSIALIMYTSGTTGNPKGVMHSHGSLTAGITVMELWLYSMYEQIPEECYVSYLPLAHILEFGVVNIFLMRGVLVGFGSPRTLTDLTTRPHGDFAEYKPTFIIGVPRIFDTLRRAIEAKLPPPGSFKRQVFDRAYESRLRAIRAGKDTPYWNARVFVQARQALGGRVRAMLSGGGPLSASTQEFINVVCGLMVIGWGLTETVCCGAIQRVGDIETNCAGQVLITEEVKLRDTDTYKHTDRPEPRGEICLRGPFMFKGYFKQPELTAEVLDSEGWFRTGDVGSITQHNKVRIIGRIKALAKNAMGEYIALETLEAIYANHPIVLNNCICVMVNPYKHYIGALAITDKNKAMHFAAQHGISTDCGYPALLKEDNFRQCVVNSLAEMGQKAKRKRFEFIKTLILLDDEWTPENGMMTAALKLRRNEIATRYAKEVDELFTE